MSFTLSSLHFQYSESVWDTFCRHINLFLCYASHHLKQNSCLALQLILFCLRITAYNFRVSFLMLVLDLDFFALVNKKNMSGSPQGHHRRTSAWKALPASVHKVPLQRKNMKYIFKTQCRVHATRGSSTHAKAFTLLQSYCSSHLSWCVQWLSLSPSLLLFVRAPAATA